MQVHWIWMVVGCVLSLALGALIVATINGRKFKALRMEKAQHALHNICFEWHEFEGKIIAIFRTSAFANVHHENGVLVKAIEFQRGCKLKLARIQEIMEQGEVVVTMTLVEEK